MQRSRNHEWVSTASNECRLGHRVVTLVFFRSLKSGICIQLSRYHGIIPRGLAGGGRRGRRATLGSGGRCGGIIRAALDRVPSAAARRSWRHAPSRGPGQPRIPIVRRTATDPHSRDQREPIHLFSVLDSPPCLSPDCPRGSLLLAAFCLEGCWPCSWWILDYQQA